MKVLSFQLPWEEDAGTAHRARGRTVHIKCVARSKIKLCSPSSKMKNFTAVIAEH